MFLAVLDNAIKFSSENSTVDILVEQISEKTVISVIDHGIGMSEEEEAHIFDKFFQTSTSENLKGSGLGLAIVREIAQRHKIAIEVESTKGVGTIIRFTFIPEKDLSFEDYF